MARLRKASPLEPVASFQQPNQTRPRRSSPRKAVRDVSYIISSDEDEENVPLRPKISKRDLSDPPSIFQDDTFYTSRTHDSPSVVALTPRKQRTLRPIETNNQLLEEPIHEGLASPGKKYGSEKRPRRERSGTYERDVDVGRKRNLMYARSLARSLGGKQLKKASSKIDVLGEVNLLSPTKADKGDERPDIEMQEVNSDPEDETSILCGDDAGVNEEKDEQQIEMDDSTDHESDEHQATSEDQVVDSDDEDDVVVPVRSRQRRPQRRIESDSESEYEEEEPAEVIEEEKRQQEQEQEGLEEPQPLVSMRPPHRKGYSTISNWAQEVIDLTDEPELPNACVLPEAARARSSSFAMSRPETSASNDVQPFLT
jgi:hypothetical protein